MAGTFKALSALADWKHPSPEKDDKKEPKLPVQKPDSVDEKHDTSKQDQKSAKGLALHYDIHIHLPESRDPAVFDAIFEAMKKHLSA